MTFSLAPPDNQVVLPVVFPHLGVPKVLGIIGRGFDYRVGFGFREVNPVIALSDVLVFPEMIEVISSVVVVTSVN